MMIKHVYKALLLRMAVGTALIAAALAGTIYFFETDKVDSAFAALATVESRLFVNNHRIALGATDPQSRSTIAVALNRFIQERHNTPDGHFVLADLYAPDRTLIAEAASAFSDPVDTKLDRLPHRFPPPGEISHQRVSLGGAHYVMVVVPMAEEAGKLLGWFEGAYRVSPEVAGRIEGTVVKALALVVVAVLATAVLLTPIIITQNRRLARFSAQVLKANVDTLTVLGSAIAKRDSDTNAHNFRVTILAIRLAESVGLPPPDIRELIKGAFLHDVGKIAISDSILLKPGRLTREEFAVMQTHVTHGIDIVNRSDWLREAAAVVRYHHEKFDGSGYMEGLKGKRIPVVARIFAIADVFDALTSRRPYKDPIALDPAMEIIRSSAGSHFDPKLVAAFEGIAPALYHELVGCGEDKLEEMLRGLTSYYFEDAA
ncbi:MAG: HD domain-containing protein [Rhodospirillales bacterium]|nr:HD domain-containing protein [Rhodospirillales bacterium]